MGPTPSNSNLELNTLCGRGCTKSTIRENNLITKFGLNGSEDRLQEKFK